MACVNSVLEVYYDGNAPELDRRQQAPLHSGVSQDVSPAAQQQTVLGPAHASEPAEKSTFLGIWSRKHLFFLALAISAFLGARVGGGVTAGALRNTSAATYVTVAGWIRGSDKGQVQS